MSETAPWRGAEVGGVSCEMVRPERFELPTYCSGGNRSIQSELRAHFG